MSIPFSDRETLIKNLRAHLPTLSAAQRKVAAYLLDHYAEAPFMTSSELARAAGTSQPSVTRFASSLGWASYSEFSRALGRVVLGEIGEKAPVERFSRQTHPEGSQAILESESAHLQSLAQVAHSLPFQRSAQKIAQANRVLVAGFGLAGGVAEHLGLSLARLRPNVLTIRSLEALMMVQLVHFRPGDYLLLCAVPRYPKETYTLAQLFHKRKIDVGLIVDRPTTRIAPLATELLIAPTTLSATTVLTAAPLVLGCLLCDAVAQQSPRRSVNNLGTFEEVATEIGLFPQDAGDRRPKPS